MFLETSEEQISPEVYQQMLMKFADLGIFNEVVGLMIGKPKDEKYYQEYKQVLKEIGKEYHLPIIYNVNFGHGHPRTILPYGIKTEIDLDQKRIFIKESFIN
jgi:muramoyltetrapeptide carboxypeptidase LdcA involved in peptidoglycan recycling